MPLSISDADGAAGRRWRSAVCMEEQANGAALRCMGQPGGCFVPLVAPGGDAMQDRRR